jgi:hypothetical protein
MSIDLSVFLDRRKLPTLPAWANAISQEGFAISFPVSVDLKKHTGFLPAMFGEEESGFEFFISDLDDNGDLLEELRPMEPNASLEANFVCHGMQECLMATAAAAVLAEMTGGVFSDPQSGEFLRGQEEIVRARADLDAAARKEAEQVAKHGKLSPAKWAEAFEQTLQRVNPDYRLNKDYRKQLLECIRQDAAALFLSQNCVRINDNYSHCFAILLTSARLSLVLRTPFVLGSRFDHNYTIAHAYNRDYRAGMKWHVAPQEWHSNYRATIRGTRQWGETTARSAEEHLYPLYVDRIINGAERLLSLFQDAALYLREWGISEKSLKEPVREGRLAAIFAEEFYLESSPADWNEDLLTYYNALHLADANGFSGEYLLSHRQNAINSGDDIAMGAEKFLGIPNEFRNAAVFVRYIEDFLVVRDELPRIIKVIEFLQSTRPKQNEDIQTPDKPWWHIW